MWKEKSIAFCAHFLVTLVTSGVTAYCVYGLWYPGAFAHMVGGADILRIIIIAEVCLGPVLSFVIFNSKKTRKHLVADYSVIAAFQFVALAYGVYTVAHARPIYMVFVKDRIEVVSRTELSENDLKKVRYSGVQPSWLGPKSICVDYPVDPQERSDLLLSALGGKDIQLLPNYYRACEEAEVLGKSFPKERLFADTKIKQVDLPKSVGDGDFTWLPLVTRFGAWIVVYVKGENELYLNLDPFAEDPSKAPSK